MASLSLIDRADVHKSCKTIETIMAVLVSYTETATALANIQKKLAKALREVAAVKGTNNVPANALTAGAVVFEALSEVDAKFSKIVDKEAENIGNEVKKWFKKLAKEEKSHDERMATANAKIKQAGQAYEKMAKRKDRDVTEEHSRYVAILNTLGPEMQQDKHKHALFITQRHTATLSEFAAALARLAEAEWFRACEQVRKFAPFIGNLGEWRVLCEGSWSGPTPGDLPDVDKLNADTEKKPLPHTEQAIPRRPSPNASEYSESLSNSINSRLPYLNEASTDTRDALLAPPPLSTITQDISRQPVRQRSINVDTGSDMTSLPPSKPASPMEPSIPEEEANEVRPSRRPQERLSLNTGEAKVAPHPSPLSEEPSAAPPIDATSVTEKSSLESTVKAGEKPAPIPQRQEEEVKELAKAPESTKPSEADRVNHTSSPLGRNFTGELSTERRNSLVAAMRERYDSRPDPLPPQPSSPHSRDIPRSSPKVNDLATRYAPVDSPVSSSRGTWSNSSVQSNMGSSSTDHRFTTFQERRHNRLVGNMGEGERPQPDYFDEREEQPRYSVATTPVRSGQAYPRGDWDDYPGRRDRFQDRGYTQQEYDEMGTRRRADPFDKQLSSLEEKEALLREQGRQIERERARLADERQRETERQSERERQRDDRESGYASDTHMSSSYGGRRLYSASPQPISVNSEVSVLRPLPVPADHAPNCGCQRCSAQHYRSPAGAMSSPSLAGSNPVGAAGNNDGPIVFKPDPPIQLRPEKPKGWFRRMSMPVASIVGSDKEKKTQSPGVAAVNPTRVHMAVPEEDVRVRRRSFEGDDGMRPGVAGVGAGGGTGRYAYGGGTTGRRY